MSSYISESDGALVLEFGSGDLAIACGHINMDDPPNELIIYANETPKPIGNKNTDDIGKRTTEVKTLLRMVFNDPRSLDVVIHQMNQMRESMSGAPKWNADEHDLVNRDEATN